MKKILFTLLFVFGISGMAMAAPITVTSYTSPNDVTVTNLENNQNTMVNAINSQDGALIQTGTINAAALSNSANPEVRWGRAFNDWVFTGLTTPTTSGTLTSTTTLGEAFITDASNNQKFVEKGATANTYTATKWTYVDLNSGGTYTYVETGIDTAEPEVTANSLRLSRVSTNGTEVTDVRDDRILSISLGNAEDQFRQGFILTVVTPATLTVNPGVVFHGTTRIEKTADITLDLGTAADWATGTSGRATSTKGYVVINSIGSIKLAVTAPTLTDTSGNSAGELRYSVINSVKWRVLNWFFMNSNGSGDIENQGFGKWSDTYLPGDIIQKVTKSIIVPVNVTATFTTDDTPPLYSEGDEIASQVFTPVSATSTITIEFDTWGTGSAENIALLIWINDATGSDEALAVRLNNSGPSNRFASTSISHSVLAGSTTSRTYYIVGGVSSNSFHVGTSTTGGDLFGAAQFGQLIITEIKN